MIIASWNPARAQSNCAINNTAIKVGEKINYAIYYSVAGAYINAGKASFETKMETLNSKPVIHVTGLGSSNKSYDFIFKVRDKYETFIDPNTFQPLKFLRNVNEGGHKINQNVTFNKHTNTAITNEGLFKVPACVQDVLSAVYYARNINFELLQYNDKISFSLFLDNEVFDMYVRYLGRETITTQYGTFKTHKFKPLLLEGTIFKGGEKMTVWVTDDENHLPVRIESPIVVGSVKVDMMGFKDIRYPLTSLIKRR